MGGRITAVADDEAISAVLKEALQVAPDETQTRAHVHGFHTYPARLHPVTASVLIRGLSRPGDAVLDPFCGSGTVLVEARLLGRKAVGSDANPLAVRLATLKANGINEADRATLENAAKRVAEHAQERRLSKAGPSRKYGRADRDLFEVHVLLELDGLRHGIREVPAGRLRDTLALILSSILIKVSRQPGDTSRDRVGRRLAAGYTTKLFVKRTAELCRQLAQYDAALPAKRTSVRVTEGDARRLRGMKTSSIGAVVTSPPYPGVYDYLEQHSGRIRWLGLDARGFRDREVGSRRQLAPLTHEEARDLWTHDMRAVLGQMARVLRPGGYAALVLADAVLDGVPLYADEAITDMIADSQLKVVGRASQAREHFHVSTAGAFDKKRRQEHVILLRREKGSPASGPSKAAKPRSRGGPARKSSSRGRAKGGRGG